MVKALAFKLLGHFQADSLFRNSIYLMASTGVIAASGFLFWVLVARIFPTHDVGIATTLISAIALLSNLSLLGFNSSLIRYLPLSQKKNEKINSALMLVVSASVITALVFLAGLRFFSPHLLFLQTNIFYIVSFVLFAVGASFNTLIESVFIAHRASGNVLIKNSILSILKLALPLLLVFLGSYGIFASVSIATLISSIFGFFVLLYKYAYQPSFHFDKDVVKEMAFFSGGTYLSGFLSQSTTLILPLLIVNFLNAKVAAYYYISSMMLSFLMIIPQATTQSLVAEGSHDMASLRKHFTKSLGIISLFLIPAILIFVLFGDIILHVFGKEYATEGFRFLQIISFSAIFSAISSLGNSLLRLKHKITYLVGMNAMSAIIVLGGATLFVSHGLIALGWSLLLSQITATTLYVLFFWKKKLV